MFLENSENIGEQEIFLCSPGAETFYYSYKACPERLYRGPLHQDNVEDVIVGETREQYYTRVVRKKIDDKFKGDRTSSQAQEAFELAKKVVHDYCGSESYFALLDMKYLKNMPVSIIRFKEENAQPLCELIEAERSRFGNFREKYVEMPADNSIFSINTHRRVTERSQFDNFFTTRFSDLDCKHNFGDVVTLAKYIPKEAVSIVQVPDLFKIRQEISKIKGCQIGQNASKIEDLIPVINNVTSESDLQKVSQQAKNIVEYAKSNVGRLTELAENRLGTTDKEEIRKMIYDLRERKEETLGRKFIKKDGINSQCNLTNALKKVNMQNLLEEDEELLSDDLQYKSNLHGVNHTRRVNFFANILANEEGLTEEDKKILKVIVKNHDIGRKNDEEDSRHGEDSVELLRNHMERENDFNEEDKRLIEFVIREHSQSASTNLEHIGQLPTELQERYTKMLNIFKDSDKLDRVRLDIRGNNPREGLDASRLSTRSAINLEGVAYETYDKLFELFEIEKQLMVAEQYLECTENIEHEDELNQITSDKSIDISRAKVQKRNFVDDKTRKSRGGNIKNIFEKVKNVFKKKEKENEIQEGDRL